LFLRDQCKILPLVNDLINEDFNSTLVLWNKKWSKKIRRFCDVICDRDFFQGTKMFKLFDHAWAPI
jgi:hypothetical protein